MISGAPLAQRVPSAYRPVRKGADSSPVQQHESKMRISFERSVEKREACVGGPDESREEEVLVAEEAQAAADVGVATASATAEELTNEEKPARKASERRIIFTTKEEAGTWKREAMQFLPYSEHVSPNVGRSQQPSGRELSDSSVMKDHSLSFTKLDP